MIIIFLEICIFKLIITFLITVESLKLLEKLREWNHVSIWIYNQQHASIYTNFGDKQISVSWVNSANGLSQLGYTSLNHMGSFKLFCTTLFPPYSLFIPDKKKVNRYIDDFSILWIVSGICLISIGYFPVNSYLSDIAVIVVDVAPLNI